MGGNSPAGGTAAPADGGTILAVHLTALRDAMDQTRLALGIVTIPYTDPSLAGAAIKATHLQQLQEGVR